VFIRRRLSSPPRMKINEIHSKSVLLPSKIYDHVVNPYAGCRHGCAFCYARFIKRFTGHKER
jgi:DNA repair photolyase